MHGYNESSLQYRDIIKQTSIKRQLQKSTYQKYVTLFQNFIYNIRLFIRQSFVIGYLSIHAVTSLFTEQFQPLLRLDINQTMFGNCAFITFTRRWSALEIRVSKFSRVLISFHRLRNLL